MGDKKMAFQISGILVVSTEFAYPCIFSLIITNYSMEYIAFTGIVLSDTRLSIHI